MIGERRTPRDGIALVSALSLLTLLGLLTVGAVASATIAQRAARLSSSDAALTSAADYALGTVLGDPSRYGLADLPLGTARTFDVAVPATTVHATVAITRLPAGVLWLVADATLDGTDRGRRRVNLIARFPQVGALPPAAIVARGAVSLAADVVLRPDTTGDPDCFAANPPPFVQTSDSAAVYQTARQAAMLDSAAGVRHVRGDTTIAGGSFEGILLVDGSLTFDGPFVLTGLAIARGPIRSAGGLHVIGALASYAASSGPAVDLAGSILQYSPCTVSRAFRATRPPRVIRRRAWSELF